MNASRRKGPPHFLIQSDFNNIISWCLKPQYLKESSKVVVAQCDREDPLQHWRTDHKGQLRSRLRGHDSKRLCLHQNGQSGTLQLKECLSIHQELKEKFLYNSFDNTILWLRDGSNFASYGLRVLTIEGSPPSNTNVGISKLNDGSSGVEYQKWSLLHF